MLPARLNPTGGRRRSILREINAQLWYYDQGCRDCELRPGAAVQAICVAGRSGQLLARDPSSSAARRNLDHGAEPTQAPSGVSARIQPFRRGSASRRVRPAQPRVRPGRGSARRPARLSVAGARGVHGCGACAPHPAGPVAGIAALRADGLHVGRRAENSPDAGQSGPASNGSRPVRPNRRWHACRRVRDMQSMQSRRIKFGADQRENIWIGCIYNNRRGP